MSLQIDEQIKKKARVGSRKFTTNNNLGLEMTPAVWVNEEIHWLSGCSEKIMMSESISIQVKVESIHSKIFLQHVHVTNHNDHALNIVLLFMNQPLHSTMQHFTFVSPIEDIIYHVSGHEMYLINGYCNESTTTQLTVQPVWNIGAEQFWSNQQKGLLRYQPMGKGAFVSVLAFELTLKPHETTKASCWIIQSDQKKELVQLNKTILQKHTSISI